MDVCSCVVNARDRVVFHGGQIELKFSPSKTGTAAHQPGLCSQLHVCSNHFHCHTCESHIMSLTAMTLLEQL